MAKESSLVVYKAKGGEEVKLSIEIVRDFLVTGKKELVTVQEMMYFMGICKARGLNPFAKDCYLIKYDVSPAAIVTAIGFYQSRAKAQPDCSGWQKGVICQHKETKELRYSKGLVLQDEDVVGGWFKAKPVGWTVDFELEVNLYEYLKKTSSGEVTKFWKNPAMMIAKVAESQGLRTLWPDEFRGTVTGEEAGLQLDQIEALDLGSISAPEQEDTKKTPPPKVDTTKFGELVLEKNLDEDRVKRLDTFIKTTASSQKRKKISPEELMSKASENFPAFWAAFEKWENLSFPPPKKAETAKPEQPVVEKEPDSNPVVVTGDDEGGQPSLLPGEDPGDSGPALEPTDVVSFTDRLMAVWQDAIDKGIPMTKFSHLAITKRADVTPDNIDEVEKIVGEYKGK